MQVTSRFAVRGTRYVVAFSMAVSMTLTAGAQRRAPRDHVQRAIDALGGEAAARGITNVSYAYVNVTYQLGQEETPLSPPRGTVFNGRVVVDFANGRRLQEQESRPGGPPPPTPGQTVAAPVLLQRRITLRDMGMVENNSQQAPEPAAQLSGMHAALRLLPHRLLLTALDNATALSSIPARAYRGDSLDGVRYAAADTALLYFDRLSGNLLIIENVTDDPVLGDRRRATIFTRWTPTGAIKFPRQIDVEVNGRLAEHTNVFTASTNDVLSDATFAIPDSIAERARRPVPPAAAVAVTLADLGNGVWRAEGGSHHTLVVEQPSGLILIEAPQNRVRMAAVFDTLKSRFPNKPVQLAVNTHHHWDHSGGLRETMARGVPIVTHSRNVNFVRGVALAR
ncbi:MAG: MBL fold metallo-hydrolase, partial [Gemmatimonadaceae bacterium]